MSAAAEAEAQWRPMTDRANEDADLRRAESDARPRSKGDPPNWADLVAKADMVPRELGGPCTITGPIYTGPVMTTAQACAALEAADGRRVIGVQAYLRDDGNMMDNRDRLLRAALGAALWAMGVK
jgi:hypothetical protein